MISEKPFAFRIETRNGNHSCGVFTTLVKAVAFIRAQFDETKPGHLIMYACFSQGVEIELPIDLITSSSTCTREEAEAAVQRRIDWVGQAKARNDQQAAMTRQLLGHVRFGGMINVPFETQVETYLRTMPLEWLPDEEISAKQAVIDIALLRAFVEDERRQENEKNEPQALPGSQQRAV